ncbi:MAG TPA: hypothetical protein VN577_08995 [Terriglobales bacterium]|nr:hypothetical protein [Terriglobales bacterium]
MTTVIAWFVTVIIDSDKSFFTKVGAGLATIVLFVITVVRLVRWAWEG